MHTEETVTSHINKPTGTKRWLLLFWLTGKIVIASHGQFCSLRIPATFGSEIKNPWPPNDSFVIFQVSAVTSSSPCLPAWAPAVWLPPCKRLWKIQLVWLTVTCRKTAVFLICPSCSTYPRTVRLHLTDTRIFSFIRYIRYGWWFDGLFSSAGPEIPGFFNFGNNVSLQICPHCLGCLTWITLYKARDSLACQVYQRWVPSAGSLCPRS